MQCCIRYYNCGHNIGQLFKQVPWFFRKVRGDCFTPPNFVIMLTWFVHLAALSPSGCTPTSTPLYVFFSNSILITIVSLVGNTHMVLSPFGRTHPKLQQTDPLLSQRYRSHRALLSGGRVEVVWVMLVLHWIPWRIFSFTSESCALRAVYRRYRQNSISAGMQQVEMGELL